MVGAAIALVIVTALPGTAGSTNYVSVDDFLPIFTESQKTSDELPAIVDITTIDDVRVDTSRRIGSDDLANYWVVRSGSSDVCLIAYIPGGNDVAAATCAPIIHIYDYGMGLSVGDGPTNENRSISAYLLPNDVDTTEINAIFSRISDNTKGNKMLLMTANQNEIPAIGNRLLPREKGGTLEFIPLATSDK